MKIRHPSDPKSTTRPYPALKALFDRRWDEISLRFPSSNFKEVAANLCERFEDKIGPRLRSYRYGTRRPRLSELDEVAGWFFDERTARADFVRQLRDAAYPDLEEPDAGPYLTPSGLRKGRSLKVGGIDYSYFCNPTDRDIEAGVSHGFIDTLLERFLRISAFPSNAPSWQTVDLASTPELLKKGQLDVVMGILAVADRLLDLSFFALLPIRISLNAVVWSSEESIKQKVSNALTRRSIKGQAPGIVPIILPTEVGGIYVNGGLQWQNEKREVKQLKPDEFYKELFSINDSGKIGVAVADEISCLEIIRHSKNKGADKAELVFALSGTQKDSNLSYRLPQYMLACATHVEAGPLSRLLRHAMRLYVDSDYEAIIREYVELFGNLAGRAKAAGSSNPNAVEWALHQLRLGHADRFPPDCMLPDSIREEAQKILRSIAGITVKRYEPSWLRRHAWISNSLNQIYEDETKKGDSNGNT